MSELSPVKRALKRIEELEEKLGQERRFEPVAIVSMACRLPGGVRSPEDFWKLLAEARDAIVDVPAGRWPLEAYYSANPDAPGKHISRQGGFISDPIDEFDAGLFGIAPAEANALDPQHRLLLETSWEAWENAGIPIDSLKGSQTGVWIGISASDYTQAHLRSGDATRIGPYDVTGSIGSTAAGRLSYVYDLRGPSLAVDTACSSSLVAIDLACGALRERTCGMALVGGVSLMLSPEASICFSKMQALAPDGRSKAFDASANGFGRGEGCAVLVLERLEDAQRTGHPVLAVIRSSAVNQDGRSNGLTAPSVDAQTQLLRAALGRGALRASDIGYIEAHGTGTPLGDPIEMEAIAEVLGRGRTDTLWIGSVKTNIGHLEAAAGVAGVIKTVLALQHGKIPAHLHFRQPSPHIPWDDLPVRVPLTLSDWTGVRRAGVSSFGFSGTNAHVILEQAPEPRKNKPMVSQDASLLCLSAKDEASLSRMVDAARNFCEANPKLPFEEICRAYRTERQHLNERAGFCGTSLIQTPIRGRFNARPRLVFAFTGQGSQYAGMGRDLYESEPVFREAFDRCAAEFDRTLPQGLGSFCFEGATGGGLSLNETQVTQAALFALGFALSEVLGAWGVRPEAVLGHSVGEYTAAVLAGVFSLEDACRLVAARGALMQALPRNGGMASVSLDPPAVEEALRPYAGRLEIAAWNGPSSVTVSGESEALSALLGDFEARGVRHKRLAASHAFHSRLMDPMLAEFRRYVVAWERKAPRIPVYSNVTGSEQADLTSAEYWVEQLRRAVRFEECVRAAAGRSAVFVELGPDPILSALGAQIAPEADWIATLRKGGPCRRQLLETAGHLYVRGANLDWSVLGRPARHIRLPNYPFERQCYWMDPPTSARTQRPIAEMAIQPLTAGRAAVGVASDSRLRAARLPADGVIGEKAETHILGELANILRDSAGLDNLDPKANLLDLSIDSLMLMTTRQRITDRYGVEIAVSKFFDELSSLDKIAAYLESQLARLAPRVPPETVKSAGVAPQKAERNDGIPLPPGKGQPLKSLSASPELFVPYKPITAEDEPGIDDRKSQHLLELTRHLEQATAPSKELAERYRPVLANNRHIAGFRPAWKEMVYQLSAEGAKGAHIRAAGGRDFIDMTMGFGVHLFGHKPPFIQEALRRELERGSPLGPMSVLAGPTAEKFCRMTGMDRVAFYNTGSEAVMTALRIARTVTQRNRIALFEGSYHGTFDGVLALRKEKDGRLYTAPGSPGTPPGMTEDVMVLRYDDPQSLELVERYGGELAAVLTEPVQSRRPDVRPKKFLEDLRELTKKSGTALIFDEMVSGFRCHAGGAQAYFGIRADMATYGKVIGGGMPIGLVAGSAEYMDAVDGGSWRFGDDSYPRKRNTFVAGTFCHHPLALAAMSAVLDKLSAEGPALQETLNRRTTAFCDKLNAWFTENEAPIRVGHFGSLLRFFLRGDLELLFYHLIARGIYVWEGRNCFLSTAHTDDDLERVAQAVFESVEDLRNGGYLPTRTIAGDAAPVRAQQPAMAFSLFYFSSSSQAEGEGYRLLMEGAKYADQNGFTAVWTPERHFHDFGGLYPNPAITCAALASATSRIRIRAGSVVMLLHDPVRFAEDWAMVDRLSGGRVDLALAPGWNSNDFIFAPDRFEERSRLLPEHLATVRRLWRGETVERTGGKGETVLVHAYPRPVQAQIPIWFTAAGNPETFQLAGQHGANVLTYLEGQTLEDLSAKVAAYRELRRTHGHAGRGHVTLMLHTYLGKDLDDVMRGVDKPLREYLKSSLFLRTQFANSLGAYLNTPSDEDLKPILDRAVDRYIRTCSLIGTPESCRETVRNAAAAGVDEIGCLIDFGVPFDEAMRGLDSLKELKDWAARPPARKELTPLTEEQRQLWYLTRQGREASVAYNEMVLLRLAGPLAVKRLEEALNRVALRHEALRTVQIGEGGQAFADRAEVVIEVMDFRAVADEKRAAEIAKTLDHEAAREFDFKRGPLFRAVLLATARDEHLFLFTAHHMVANGWSIGLALEETAAIYSALENGGQPKLPPVTPFGRYLEWEEQQEKAAAEDEVYWSLQLSAPVPACELPTSRPRGPAITWRGKRRTFTIDAELLRGLRATARQNGSTLFMVLLGGWETLIWRLTGAPRIAVWTPVARQAAMGAQVLAGQCTRMFPVVAEFDEATTGNIIVSRVKSALLDVYAHQNRSLARIPGINVPPAVTMFNLDRAPGLPKFAGLSVSLETAPVASAKYELSLNALEIGGQLIFDAEYRRDLFNDETVEAWMAGYRAILRSLAEDADQPLRQVDMTSGHGIEPAKSEDAASVLETFERQAARRPSRVALRRGDKELTFGQLEEDASRLATAIQAHGVQRGDGVGLDSEDPLEAITARLALMKLGAFCIEPDRHSILAMLRWCERSALLLSRSAAAQMMRHGNVLDLDELRAGLARNEPLATTARVDANDLACVFELAENSFACTHATIASQAAAARSLFGIREDDRIAVWGKPGLETIFGALTAGATLTFGDDDLLTSEGTEHVDVAFVPAHLDNHPAISEGRPRLTVFTDGPVSRSAATRFEKGPAILEICRPAGIPLLAAAGDRSEAGLDRRGVLCRSVYLPGSVIGDRGEPACEGTIGQWVLAGARGPCPTETRVQPRHDGILWLVSRGGEIETALRDIVPDAVVYTAASDPNERARLAACVVVPEGVTIPKVRSALAATLPPEIMPESFARASSIPERLRANPGALGELAGPMQTGRDYTAPRNEHERKMCALWEEILQCAPVGVDDNFADLGGQSLDATRLTIRVRLAFGATLTLEDLLSAPTPGKLCCVVLARESGGAGGFAEIPLLPAQRDYELSRAQLRMWAMAQAMPDQTGYNVPVAALLAGPLQVDALQAALRDLALRHESLRTRFVQVRGEPRQVIDEAAIAIEVLEASSIDEIAALRSAAGELASAPFELGQSPLWRVRVIRFSPNRHGLVMVFHHIVTDGWSIEVCSRDLGALYQARLGHHAAPPALSLQYRDYAAWDNARWKADSTGPAWWQERLAGAVPIELPRDFKLPAEDCRVATLRVPFGEELTRQFDCFCRSREITRFIGLTAATANLLYRLSGANDITLGTPVAHREHPQLEEQAGLFVNTVALRESIGPLQTFAGLAQAMRRTSLDAMAHAGTPFDLIVQRVGVIINVMVAFEEHPRAPRNWGDVRVTPVDVPPVASLFDLNFRFQAEPAGLWLALDYRPGLFESGRIELWAGRFTSLLGKALADPEREIGKLDMRSEVERRMGKRHGRAEIHL